MEKLGWGLARSGDEWGSEGNVGMTMHVEECLLAPPPNPRPQAVKLVGAEGSEFRGEGSELGVFGLECCRSWASSTAPEPETENACRKKSRT